MSFREKSAWITLIALVLVSALWATHVPWSGAFTLAPDPSPVSFHALAHATISVIAEVVSYAARIVYHRRGF